MTRPSDRAIAQAELLPCPFCGTGDPLVMGPTCNRTDRYNPADRLFPIVRCRGCLSDICGSDDDASCASAVAKWNTRATAAPVVVGEDMVAVAKEAWMQTGAYAPGDEAEFTYAMRTALTAALAGD